VRPKRFPGFALTVAVALATAAPAIAANPTKGFYVFKDFRNAGVIEFRDASTGRVLSRDVGLAAGGVGSACDDSHHTMSGARWRSWEPYFVNGSSTPAGLNAGRALAVLRSAHEAWESPFVTDCPLSVVPGPSPYGGALYGGTTPKEPSLAHLELDGENTVAFGSLDGTVCAGPGVVACVVAYSKSGEYVEADLTVEADLATQLGGPFRWTTGDTTDATDSGGNLALVDVATHEFGHWAGLGHVENSPELTMFPAVRDGMQTLGLGDMKGLLARY
jgi:hypothetical protein